MFEKWKGQMKQVPSWLYKNNLINSSIGWAVLVIAFIPLIIYCFSLKDLWYLAFIPLFIVIIMSLLYGFGIRWLWKKYKQALSREKDSDKESEE